MLRRIILLGSIVVAVLVVVAVAALVLIDPDDYRDEIAERASERLGREVRLEGPIELKLFPWLAFEIHEAHVANPPEFANQPELAEIGRATASLRVLPLLRGRLEIGAVGLEDAAFTVIRTGDGRSNLDGLFVAGDSTEADEPERPGAFETGEVRFENVLLRLIEGAGGEASEFRIDDMTLAPFAPGREVPVRIEAAMLDGGGETAMAFDFSARINLAANFETLELADWILEYELPAAGGSGQMAGSSRIAFGADVITADLTDLEAELNFADLQLALIGEAPLDLRLAEDVEIEYPALRLELNGQPLALSGEARIDERLRASLDASGERLDLAPLVPAGSDDEPATAETDLDVLQLFDLRMGLELDELILAEGARLTSVSGQGRLDSGLLVLDPMTAELFGGRFDGSASVDFNRQPPEVTLSPRLSGIMVERLAALLTSTSPIAGRGEMALDLGFRGMTAESILGSLDGNGSFTLAEGALQGIDLHRLIEEELTVSNLGDISRAFGGETPFRNLTGTLRAEEGVIHLPDLALSAEEFGFNGSGVLDFAADRVQYNIELQLGEALTAELPSRLRSATGGRIPLQIAGPVAEPVVSVDIAAIAQGALRDELARRLFGGDEDEPDAEPEEDSEDETDEESEPESEPPG